MNVERDNKGRIVYKPEKGKPSRFPPGVSGNLKGRKMGSTNKFSLAGFAKAIKYVEAEEREQFMVAWLRSAWKNPAAMSEIMNYMLPKLKSIEGLITTFDATMSDDMAKSIQEKLRKRYTPEKDKNNERK